MIIAAAIKLRHLVISMPRPARHHDILNNLAHHIRTYEDMEQGFITDTGVFLNRTDAFVHSRLYGPGTPRRDKARLAGENVYNGYELFSEDMW